MIDFKFQIVSATCFAASILLLTQARHIVNGVITAILGFASATVRGVHSVIGVSPFAVCLPPRFIGRSFLRDVFLRPSLHLGPMAMRVFGSALSSGRSFKTGARGQPSAAPINRALNAMAVRHEPLIRMPVLAWCAGRIVAFACALGCDPRRMPWLLLLAGERVFDRARRTNSGGCVSFRKVPVSAWLSGMIKAFACNLRGLALRHFVQGSTPPVSNIFIVARAA